jgi:hypothetical protein
VLVAVRPVPVTVNVRRKRFQVQYDEDRELTTYVWDHYGHLMTEFEGRVRKAISGRMKSANAQSPQMSAAIDRLWSAIGDPEIESALAEGPEAFRRQVRDRILLAHGTEVFINRCPSCGRIVRTPQARQCFWCGFDWHSPTSERAVGAEPRLEVRE